MNETSLLPVAPLRERPLHRFFAVVFVAFAASSFLVDGFVACGVDLTTSSHPLAAQILNYGKEIDPTFLSGTAWVHVMLVISAFVFGPLKLVLAVALMRGWRWSVKPTLAFLGAYVYSTAVYTTVALTGAHASPAPAKLLSIMGPYLIIPLWLIVHFVRNPDPFARRAST